MRWPVSQTIEDRFSCVEAQINLFKHMYLILALKRSCLYYQNTYSCVLFYAAKSIIPVIPCVFYENLISLDGQNDVFTVPFDSVCFLLLK